MGGLNPYPTRTIGKFWATFGAAILILLSTHRAPMMGVLTSPLSPASITPFLSPPYFGPREINSYFDHEFPDYNINRRIVLYDGRIAQPGNGVCGWRSSDGAAIAYYDRLGGQPGRQCIWYEGHSGYDFALEYEPVLAAGDGVVVDARWQNWRYYADRFKGFGLFIKIDHGNGYYTYYGHLSSIAVAPGTYVRRGQIIGTSGNTGNSTGPHLHFEVRYNQSPVDPFGGSGSEWLWLEGSWDAQGRWVGSREPVYGAPLVVDDVPPALSDPFFRKGRTISGSLVACPPASCPYWYAVTGVGYGGDMLWTYGNDDTRDYWALWEPPRPGVYEIRVFIPSRNATTWWARYWLLSSLDYMPAFPLTIDQQGVSDRWISLGIHAFGRYPAWAGLWIDDATTENPAQEEHCRDVQGQSIWCQIGVDAVQFRPVWPVNLPLVLREP